MMPPTREPVKESWAYSDRNINLDAGLAKWIGIDGKRNFDSCRPSGKVILRKYNQPSSLPTLREKRLSPVVSRIKAVMAQVYLSLRYFCRAGYL